ncbi:MAG TPA: glycoside hydrolase family 38 C-terminal domain-containing protein [Acidobacteriaceae bacterium]|jgi:alpha-mannosidase|nr:glycoside hydrolase family 38 C-terminal domain-containing protein [Acidobacteriaceae bacterium]
MKRRGIHNEKTTLSRRGFLGLLAAVAGNQIIRAESSLAATKQREVYIVSNFHPASCGWLTTFSKERVYCANSYLDHLDRVKADPNYEFVMSEINNIIAIKNFQPERIPELKQYIREKRVELVNGFFLESTINLSGGEALVRLGVEGLRWYQQEFGLQPRYAWNIDVCGTHDQMAQIASGLGFDAMVYTRKNPTGKTIYWTVSPNGSRILTLCPGHYSEAQPLYDSKTPLSADQLHDLEKFFETKEPITPAGAPILVLGGGDDYSLAPKVKQYPSQFLNQWAATEADRKIQFVTLSKYVDIIVPGIHSGHIDIPTLYGGTAYDFDAFWIENPEVKTWYRRDEHALQAAEILATIGNLHGEYSYPSKQIYDSWILMCLNMDRNTLWGSAGGMVFVSDTSWDVQDRFQWVEATTTQVLHDAGHAILPRGDEVGLFNPLNWKRSDPVVLALPKGKSLHGIPCEALADGSVVCGVEMPPTSVGGWKLSAEAPSAPQSIDVPESIETDYYSVRFDWMTGSLSSIKMKRTGRELLAGSANVIVAERPIKKEEAPADFMAARPGRMRLATSNDQPSSVQICRGPVAITIDFESKFYGGGKMRRRVRFYHNHPRIDFETELNDIPDYTVVVAEFPLAEDVQEVRRGIPYGFSHSAWAKPNPDLHGWNKGIVPAVRWIDFQLAGGGGIAILDRGLTGRELDGRTPIIYLFNAEDKYHGYPNQWTTGKGKHVLPYSIVPHEMEWAEARIPQMAWEYNQAPILISNTASAAPKSFLETSDNVIVEAVRREKNYIEVRFVECLGVSGTASVKLLLPHSKVYATDLTGRHKSTLSGPAVHEFPIGPQEIITVHFETTETLPVPEPIAAWDAFVPKQKLPALHAYDPNVKGHPPFGDSPVF